MSYKHVGTAGDLVRFVRLMLGRAPHVLRVNLLKIECTFCHNEARSSPGDERALEWTLPGIEVYQLLGTEARS
jgi:hypothetical protein